MGTINTVSELKSFIDNIAENHKRELESTVEIVIVSQGSIGGTPTVKIKDIACGFDWDNGKLLIFTEEPVIKLTQEELEDVRKSVSNAHSYHTGLIIRPLMKENKEMRDFLISLDPAILTDEQKAYIESVKKPAKRK